MNGLSGVLVAAVAGFPLAGAAEEWRDVSYRELHDALTQLALVDDARYVRVDWRFGVNDDFDGRLRMVVAAKDGDIEVPIDGSGVAAFPLSPALYEQDPPVRVNIGERDLTLNFTVAVEAMPTSTFRYALVTDMEDEFRRMLARQGLLARMFAPRPTGIFIDFDPGERGTVEVRSSRVITYTADNEGTVLIPFSRQLRRADAEFVLSHLPRKMGLSFK